VLAALALPACGKAGLRVFQIVVSLYSPIG
jgi:hypothetical protein